MKISITLLIHRPSLKWQCEKTSLNFQMQKTLKQKRSRPIYAHIIEYVSLNFSFGA